MVPRGQLSAGQIIRAYDHGYLIIWDHDAQSGVESHWDCYEPVHELCPDRTDLLGQLAVFAPPQPDRRTQWFTAFSLKQLNAIRQDAARRGVLEEYKEDPKIMVEHVIHEYLARDVRSSLNVGNISQYFALTGEQQLLDFLKSRNQLPYV